MEGTGRDPLGLSRVSDSLTNFLLPSIITTTDRARYYSFYTWAIADIQALREAKNGKVVFEEEFQRREAAFALASLMGRRTELPIVGVRAVEGALASPDEEDRLGTAFRVLPSNTTGGYGQYYGGCLHALGLVQSDSEGDLVVSPELGRRLAAAFAAATASAPYRAEGWQTRARVPKKTLQKSAKLYSLDALGGAEAEQERELLIQLFFDLDKSPSPTRPLNRQATLGLFLHLLRSCAESGVEVTRRTVDDDAIFWPHYYAGLEDGESGFLPYQTVPAFTGVQNFWRQFCAHQFLAVALEEFLAGVLGVLAAYPEGLPKASLLDEMMATGFIEDMEGVVGTPCGTPAALLAAIGINGVPGVDESIAASRRFHGGAAVNEWKVFWADDGAAETSLGQTFLVLAILYARWRGRSDDDTLLQVEQEAGKELWLGTMFPWLDGWTTDRPSWRDAVEALLDWITMRHEQVKFQKRKLDASWFEVANGRYIRQQDIEANTRASRHSNATTILQDLGLIEHAGLDDPLRLTERGNEVLNEVIRLRS
jgi:hypothetical protein